jgi:hypothetical protein
LPLSGRSRSSARADCDEANLPGAPGGTLAEPQSPLGLRPRDQMSNCVSSSLRTDRAFVSRKDYDRSATSSGSGAQAVLAADKSPHWPTHTGR